MTLFIAEYAQGRLELLRAERQLMFTRSGRPAATRLGRTVLAEAVVAALAVGAASYVGAAVPLLIGALLPSASWLALVVSVVALTVLGVVLSRQVGGRAPLWAAGLGLAGVVVTVIGIEVGLV